MVMKMQLTEIIKDAISYPLSNMKTLLIYIVLGLIVGVVEVLTGITSITTGSINFEYGILIGIIGIIIIICLLLLMFGFSLDIIKFGINRSDEAPNIELKRQISNGLKYIILSIAYMIIPAIIIFGLGFIFRHWIVIVIGLIIALIFGFVLTIAICRLAKTNSLSAGLDIKGVIEDLKSIGIGKVIITMIVATIVGFIIVFALSLILGLILTFASATIITVAVSIISAILDAWLLFYENRVMGLLYSEIT